MIIAIEDELAPLLIAWLIVSAKRAPPEQHEGVMALYASVYTQVLAHRIANPSEEETDDR